MSLVRRARMSPWPSAVALGVLAASLSGCLYGLSGGGLPSHINTLAVTPVENQSDRFDVADDIYAVLSRELPGRLGLRVSAEETADAVLRVALLGYTLGAPNYRSTGAGGATVLQRQVTLRLHVMLIDTRESTILWEEQSLSVNGAYPEEGGLEEDGRAEAIDQVLQRIVDGAQSNW